jgi:Uma2 family endonuclease
MSAVLVSVEEYLSTDYSPDRDYVAGVLEDRNVGIKDYLNMGVRYVWVVDPYSRLAWIYTNEGAFEATDGVLRTTDPVIEMPLSEVFS